MFTNITIKAQLGLAMGLMAVAVVVCSAMGMSGMKQSSGALRELYTDQMPATLQINLSLIRLAQARLALHRALMRPDAPDTAQLIDRAVDFERLSGDAWQRYLALPMGPQEKRLANEVAAKRDTYVRDGTGLAIADLRAGQRDDADRVIYERTAPLFAALNDSVDRLLAFQVDGAARAYEAAQARYDLFCKLAIGALAMTLLCVCISLWLLNRTIARPLEQALSRVSAIASGNLTSAIDAGGDNEMGRLANGLRDMQQSLRDTVYEIRLSGTAIATAASEVAAGSQDLSTRTEEQAASLEQIASSLEEITVTARQSAESAREARQMACATSRIAQRGEAAVGDVVNTMHAIRSASNRIVDIISVIDSIAFQTNILSLNAAVEAARAGDQGRGFAVVAAEVRALAQRSAQAAREIKSLIADSVGKVDAGSHQVQQAGATIGELVESVQRGNAIFTEIARASEEQTSGIEQINQAVGRMDEFTQQNAALVEQAAAAAAAMQEQAETLLRMVSAFKLGNEERQALRRTTSSGSLGLALNRHAPH